MVSAGNAYIMAMWGKAADPAMHAIHFGYSIGMVITPLMAFSFLSPDSDDVNNSTAYENITMTSSTGVDYVTATGVYDDDGGFADNSQIEIPYFICGGLTVALSVVFYAFVIKGSTQKIPMHSQKKGSFKEVMSPGSCADGDSVFGATLVSLFILYMILIAAIAIGPMTLGFTFLRETNLMDFSLEEATAWSLSVAFCQMLSRGLTIAVSHRCPIQLMLFVEITLNALATTLLVVVGTDNKIVFWVTTCVFALTVAPMWPGGFAWMDKYITLYGIVVALATVGAGLSGFIVQLLTGHLYTNVDELGIFYTTTAASLATVVVAAIMQIFGSRHGNRHDKVKIKDQFDPDVIVSYYDNVTKTMTATETGDASTKF